MKIIPPITNPLGKAWDQPDLSEIKIEENRALMTEETFKNLARYDHTNPSGVYEGKMWKRKISNRLYLLCWYGECDDPKSCSINYLPIKVVWGDIHRNTVAPQFQRPRR